MKTIALLVIILIITAISCRKSDYIVENENQVFKDNGQGTGTITLTKTKSYIIEGEVFVNEGQVLTIEPGTVIRFKLGQGENASALIVARGGKIIAAGTADEPIIFTAESDNLNGSVAKNARGLWGGLIILGNAPVQVKGGESYIEGLPPYEQRAYFGGSDPNDNSGVLKYVSIRHGGTNIGEGNEINGLTLAGVGSKTEIDYVEVLSNADDGIEIFGGSVNLRHLVIYGCGDDAFDYDMGWSGFGQFWLCVQPKFTGDNLIEGSGSLTIQNPPEKFPQVFNVTLIGNGADGAGHCIKLNNNAGGIFANSIYIHKNNGISIEATNLNNDSFNQWKTGNLSVTNNLFFEIAGSTPQSIFQLSGNYTQTELQQWINYFGEAKNEISDPKLAYLQNNFIPEVKIISEISAFPSSWFQIVDFKGAFGESDWIKSWTKLTK